MSTGDSPVILMLSTVHPQEEDNMAYIEKMVQDVDLDSNGEISDSTQCSAVGRFDISSWNSSCLELQCWSAFGYVALQ